MDKEKKDTKIIIISVFLALICVSILGYIIYMRINMEKPKEPAKPEPIVDDNEPVEDPSISLEDKAKQLYDIIKDFASFRSTGVVNYDLLSDEVKDRIILAYIRPEHSCMTDNLIVKEEFELAYQKLFNKDKNESEGLCISDGTNYTCQIDCTQNFEHNLSEYIEYKVEDSKLVIYERYGYLDYADDGNIYVRSSQDANDEIAIYETIDDIELEDIEIKLPIYKHIFALDGEDYYYEQSEIVRQ